MVGSGTLEIVEPTLLILLDTLQIISTSVFTSPRQKVPVHDGWSLLATSIYELARQNHTTPTPKKQLQPTTRHAAGSCSILTNSIIHTTPWSPPHLSFELTWFLWHGSTSSARRGPYFLCNTALKTGHQQKVLQCAGVTKLDMCVCVTQRLQHLIGLISSS